MTNTPAKALTIAGSDSGGGAGIQADLKTFAAHRVYGLSVIVALTAQNTLGVTAILDVTEEMIGAQLDAVLSDIGCDAAKTGMLSRPSTIRLVARKLREYNVRNLVVDPVMVAKSGHRLLSEDAIVTLKEELLPLARLITPNLEEVGELLGTKPSDPSQMEDAARELGRMSGQAVLVKGGHLTDAESSPDVLWTGATIIHLPSPRLEARHTHGTGCTLSAAICANLSQGMELDSAVSKAKMYLCRAMQEAYSVGAGVGPVNHLWNITESGG